MGQTVKIRKRILSFSQLKRMFKENWRPIIRVLWEATCLSVLSIVSFASYKILFSYKNFQKDRNKKGRIGIDAKILHNNVSGLERYMYQLIVHLSQIDTERNYSIFLYKPVFGNNVGDNVKEEIGQDPKDLITSQNKKFASGEMQLFHVTWQEMFLYHNLPLLWSKSSVLTIHDLINLLNPEYHSLFRRKAYKILLKCAVKWADRIITDSEYTKQDVIKHLNADEKKIKVIYLASDERFHPIFNRHVVKNTKRQYGIQGNYILTVGKFYTHKNIPHLIKAFKGLVSKGHTEHKLLLVGEKYWGPANLHIQTMIAELKLEEHVILPGHIDDEDMPAIYNGADLFVLPSLYEGFGLPLLEAMSCGIPLIASNVTSLPEIVGDAGILVNPYNIEELTQSMEVLLTDQSLRNSLITKGLERAKTFSWEKCARETLDVYNELLIP